MRKEKVKYEDYSDSDRPLNRRNQFFDLFKHRFLELFKLSLLQAVFNMPLLVLIFTFHIVVKQATDVNALMSVFLIHGGLLVVAVPFCFVGLTGSFYSLKKIVFTEGEYAASSYFIGLREEWKKGLVIGLIVGLSSAIAVIGFFFLYFYMSTIDNNVSAFGIAILAIQLIMILIVGYYSIAQIELYTNSMRYILKNSFIFTLIRSPINLGLIFIHPGIFIALCLINNITMYVGLALLFFFSVFGQLMWVMNAVSIFDKVINKKQYPDIYRKGLRKIEEPSEDINNEMELDNNEEEA